MTHSRCLNDERGQMHLTERVQQLCMATYFQRLFQRSKEIRNSIALWQFMSASGEFAAALRIDQEA
jgi:hypothetical protein